MLNVCFKQTENILNISGVLSVDPGVEAIKVLKNV